MPKPAEVTLPSDREVRVTRTFDAPRHLVWEAHTRPELVQKWQPGYEGWEMSECDMDVRVGGKYKWQWRNREDGKHFGFFGTYTEVDGPSKLVHEEIFDPGDMDISMPTGDPCIVSLQLSELRHGRFACCQPRKNGTAGGIGESGKGEVEAFRGFHNRIVS